MGCLALVDSGAQLSAITVDFTQQLKLPIYMLEQFIKLKATGGGKIPYKGYVEVNLNIPEILRPKQLRLVLLKLYTFMDCPKLKDMINK